ncbi:MAG: hypothetical protein HQL80_03695 [Magnetococcales bacterium]|nr:hypothetical protein [Magnetococcales bacterium]
MPDPNEPLDNAALVGLRRIRQLLEALNHHPLLVAHQSLRQTLFFAILKGLATGFGTVLGATLLVSWFLYLLSHVEFVPIIGDWVRMIIQQVQVGKPG